MSVVDMQSECTPERTAQHQRVRLRRLGLSAVSYALQGFLAAVIALRGATSAAIAASYIAALIVIVTIFFAVFRSGWNLRLAEPNLTFAQVLAPAVPGFVLLYHLNTAEAQMALVLTAILPLLYGTLDLSISGFLVAACVYGFGSLIAIFSHGPLPGSEGVFFNNWILLTSLAIILPQIVLLSAIINQLRRTLRDRNDEVREAMARISVMAVRDHLTGLYNRRWLMEMLESERLRCQRGPYTFCVGLIDIDHFKQINDTHGHAMGDEVLIRIGRQIVQGVRENDYFGRFGGEEFLWIMPATGLADATEAAERLRRELARLVFAAEDGSQFTVTLSLGVAQNDSTRRLSSDGLIQLADEALYEAKEQGRDLVVAAPPPPEPGATALPRRRGSAGKVNLP